MAKVVAEAIAYKSLFVLLNEYHYTQKQLHEKTGIGKTTIARWLSTFHQKPKNLIYVYKYERSKTVGPYTAYWAWGYMMPDAIRPPPISKKEKARRCRRARLLKQTAQGVIHVSA